jgi:MFS family permease
MAATLSVAERSGSRPSDTLPVALLCACFVGFAYSSNYTNHAPLAVALARQFGFDRTLAGLLTTGIFITHAGMQVPGGHLIDRLGARRLLMYALPWVAFGNFGIAFATAYWQLLAWKVFTGVGTGLCFVGGARYTHEAAAGPRLNLAQGLFGGSVLLGSGFVILAVPRLYLWVGWRGTFVVSAVMATVAWLVWIVAAPEIPSSTPPRGRFREMLLAPQLWLLGLMQMATFGLSIVVGAWIVALLVKTLGVPATQAGLLGSLVLLVGIVARPLGGHLRRHVGMRSLLAASLLMNVVGCLALAWSTNSVPLALAAVILVGTGCGLPYAALFSRAGALFPGRAGSAMGLVNMLGILMILLGAPLVGHLADWSGNFRSSFVALGVFSLIACAAIPLIGREEPAVSGA